MSSDNRPNDFTRDQHLMQEAARFTLRLLSCIPRDQIDPKKYWDWAQKAIQIGADRGQTFEKMLSEAYHQLPMKDRAIPEDQSRSLYSIGETLKSQNNFTRFRQLCLQYAPSIVVMARVEKEKRKDNAASIDAPNNVTFTEE